MNNEFLNCDCCGESIQYGKPYVCISQRVEVARHSDADDTEETEVVDSNLILVMCRKCGNKYNAQYFNVVVNAIPFRAKRVSENHAMLNYGKAYGSFHGAYAHPENQH